MSGIVSWSRLRLSEMLARGSGAAPVMVVSQSLSERTAADWGVSEPPDVLRRERRRLMEAKREWEEGCREMSEDVRLSMTLGLGEVEMGTRGRCSARGLSLLPGCSEAECCRGMLCGAEVEAGERVVEIG